MCIRDRFAALHNVDYSVIFTRKGDGTYSALYKLSDVYDFDWSGYDNFEIGFANNYCYMMQEMNWIKPFPIDIFLSLIHIWRIKQNSLDFTASSLNMITAVSAQL